MWLGSFLQCKSLGFFYLFYHLSLCQQDTRSEESTMFNNSSGSFNLKSSPSFLSLSFYLFSCPAFDLVIHLVSLGSLLQWRSLPDSRWGPDEQIWADLHRSLCCRPNTCGWQKFTSLHCCVSSKWRLPEPRCAVHLATANTGPKHSCVLMTSIYSLADNMNYFLLVEYAEWSIAIIIAYI